MPILVVGEKPSVGRALAQVVGANTRKDGYYEGNGYIVSWCFGHLVQLLMPNDYGGTWAEHWSFSQLPMIPETWRFKVGESCEEQFGILKRLLNDSDVSEIICATDADREGECIFRYVYHLSGCKRPFQRLWISSLEETAIRAGMKNLKPGSAYDNLYAAGFSRAKADWLVGMNGSRLFTCRYPGSVLSLGRVQTPTLAMIVQRDYDVAHFVKQKYFTVLLDCGTFSAESERIDDLSRAETIVQKVTGQTAAVTDLKKEIKTANPPKLYDLTTLQRDANKSFGMTAQQTLNALQALYEAKLATYPRTDSQYLSDDMEKTALDVLGKVNAVFPQFGQAQTVNIQRCINNKKVTGHHAILPTVKIDGADLSALSDAQRNILHLIAARLVLATAEPHKYEAVKVTVQCAGEIFTANGKKIMQNGWKELESKVKAALKSQDTGNEDEKEAKPLPELQQGQTFENVNAKTEEHWTSPPKPYTEDTLLAAMERAGNDEYDDETEKKGIGTPATRAPIIERLVKLQYVARKGKTLTATEKGVKLIAVVPDEVKSPKLTAEWEMQLQQIERGQYSAQAFMDGILTFVKGICTQYGAADESVSFSRPNTPIGKCPHCGGDVQKGKYGYYCTQKCGMYLAKVFGKELTDFQLTRLLAGKEVTFTANGRKTVVLPHAVEHTYNGKTSWQWEARKG